MRNQQQSRLSLFDQRSFFSTPGPVVARLVSMDTVTSVETGSSSHQMVPALAWACSLLVMFPGVEQSSPLEQHMDEILRLGCW